MGLAYLGNFELHKRAPLAGDVAELGRAVLDAPSDGVVCAREEALGLEFEVGVQVLRIVAHGTCITEFKHHLSKEDATRVHVRHRQRVFWTSKKGHGVGGRNTPAGDTATCQSVSQHASLASCGDGEGGGVRN